MISSTEQKLKLLTGHNPFTYGLGVRIVPSKTQDDSVTICCHGYGHCNEIVDIVGSFGVLPGYLIGFNFPDYGIRGDVDHAKSTFGSIQEILPLLYLIKQCVCDVQVPVLNLYGFSAGGGAIINALVILNQFQYQNELASIGITQENRKQIIDALERGLIILDCPLKSVDECVATQGWAQGLILARQFSRNNMSPIEVLPQLAGLKLNILLHFQNPDEILSNRDDELYVERLTKANGGKTTIEVSFDGGHNSYHAGLWDEYEKIKTGCFSCFPHHI